MCELCRDGFGQRLLALSDPCARLRRIHARAPSLLMTPKQEIDLRLLEVMEGFVLSH